MKVGDRDIIEEVAGIGLRLKRFKFWHDEKNFKLIKEATMSESMKDRIEALTGWDAEAEEIRKEIQGSYDFVIESFGHGGLLISIKDRHGRIVHSLGSPLIPCRKLGIFKEALLWLYEQSGGDKKDARRKEIADLKARIERLENEE